MKAKKPARNAASASVRTRGAAGTSQRRRRPASEAKPAAAAGNRSDGSAVGTRFDGSAAQPRSRKTRDARDARPQRSAPRTTPIARPKDAPARPKSASQAKARAKARKAKAPKVVRPPLRQRILERVASIDLDPRRLVARVPFVVLVIGALGLGLGVTLWLSTDAAERSYQLGTARELNQALLQQKEALERDVLEAQAAPALAEAARDLGMIPSRDTAHLVQDATGNWVVVGTPKPAEGVPPPPLNAPLPEPAPPARPAPRVVEPREVPVRIPSAATPPVIAPGVPAMPLGVPGTEMPHAVSGQLPTPGPSPLVAPQVPQIPAVAVPHTAPAPPPAAPLAAPPVEHFAPAAPAPAAPAPVVPEAPA